MQVTLQQSTEILKWVIFARAVMAVDVEQLYKSFGVLADAKENAKQVSVV